ncbi:MAG: HEPN/Toprim-associated domain-containing protein [Phreatobacter sp.]|uniref:HEPN/Toprim-associated domain-containing protein n=1 Tax=Phreatobacter sp. TaxID=1966341 RepID=UPI0027364D41|nr:HEPN/Toprim-associated domain-containing protein [Phreatobacter sp.]MDP2803898.1 HEPN/Toprim-associated domain-containing protein [Phreatobacter sp.]
MGSMIHLSVGRLELDWGKNSGFTDHSALFQVGDVTKVPYWYADEETPIDEADIASLDRGYRLRIEYRDGMSKPLAQVVERIGLLGYTPCYARREFHYLSQLNSFDEQAFSFDQLAAALRAVDVEAVSADYSKSEGESFGRFFRREMADRLGLDRDTAFAVSEAMENFSPYILLQMMADNPSAVDLPVNWQFADVEYGGWAKRGEFAKRPDQANRFLIVTEGSSDANIIRHAIGLLKPHLADFFDFADMNEGYPFTGTGNLFNFTKGLISISIMNNIIVVYDNDAEGVFSYNRTSRLNLLSNMRVLKLPDLAAFESFDTVGPSGSHRTNINGRGAAIECYLDAGAAPIVRWNNFHKELGVYQGELVGKTDVARGFLGLKALGDIAGYDTSRIEAVVEMIVNTCANMRESARLMDIERQIETDFPPDQNPGA